MSEAATTCCQGSSKIAYEVNEDSTVMVVQGLGQLFSRLAAEPLPPGACVQFASSERVIGWLFWQIPFKLQLFSRFWTPWSADRFSQNGSLICVFA